MVFIATAMASTSGRPPHERLTARTILLRSTGSRVPLRLVTRMEVWSVMDSAGSLAGRAVRASVPWLRGVASVCIGSSAPQRFGVVGVDREEDDEGNADDRRRSRPVST